MVAQSQASLRAKHASKQAYTSVYAKKGVTAGMQADVVTLTGITGRRSSPNVPDAGDLEKILHHSHMLSDLLVNSILQN